ncbi:MAG: hypothetical protein RL131_76 [Bacteroidota bacterium]|jgi:glucokinase
MSNASLSIGIDLGGTRIKTVVMNSTGNVLEQMQFPTNDNDQQTWKNSIRDHVNQILEAHKVTSSQIGISAPGLPNRDNSAISFMPGRMQGLENFIWESFLNCPTKVINDAVAALMAEARLGACKHAKHALMVTLGTGVGGAILIDGKAYQGAFQKAGHVGHMVIDPHGSVGITGMPGSLEQSIGNCTVRERSQGKFNSTHELLDAASHGDAFAKEIWLKSIRNLALGLSSLSNILSPEIIVIGGGIAEANDHLFEPLNDFMEHYEWRPGGQATEIKKAEMGEWAGAIGAAYYALES